MKIWCHNGILPNIEVLNQYGIKVIYTFKKINEWERNSYIIELPKNLKVLRGNELPKIVASTLGNVIVDENSNIICSLLVSSPTDYALENISEEDRYDYSCAGAAKFYRKRYPSPTDLDNMSREDMDKFVEIIEEMKEVQPEEKGKSR